MSEEELKHNHRYYVNKFKDGITYKNTYKEYPKLADKLASDYANFKIEIEERASSNHLCKYEEYRRIFRR